MTIPTFLISLDFKIPMKGWKIIEVGTAKCCYKNFSTQLREASIDWLDVSTVEL